MPPAPLIRARTEHFRGTASPSVTQTQTLPQTPTDDSTDPSPTIARATLRFRGAHDPAERRRQRRREPAIRWADDVVDNEGMGRKSSKGWFPSVPCPLLCYVTTTVTLKGCIALTCMGVSLVCCIYHSPRAVGESSSEEDSSSSSDEASSDDGGGDSSGVDDGAARPIRGGKQKGKGGRGHHRRDMHDHDHDHDHGKHGAGNSSGKESRRRPSPNAYERMPKTNAGPKGSKGG